ncbi:hypothetical protein [Myroides indicus]|uniref:Uncharacterized protein n=1 Tax=Myroides indicus TaxID=1323422 RepID=A0A4R7F306_9FLAO|nr:hypothetical protein [Myroides indicus]TDS61541.1 hypothetical protein C8P70_10882 [Myroides indicus]
MITKIQIKLNNDILPAVIQVLEHTKNQKTDTLQLAVLNSIRADLLIKFEEKTKNIQKQISILDHNKKHNFVLKYHEAYALHQFISQALSIKNQQDNPHFKKLGRLVAELHGKVFVFAKEKENVTLEREAEAAQGQTSLF